MRDIGKGYWKSLENDYFAVFNTNHKALPTLCSKFFIITLDETDINYPACNPNDLDIEILG